jgi:hypothetical protein
MFRTPQGPLRPKADPLTPENDSLAAEVSVISGIEYYLERISCFHKNWGSTACI